MHGDNWKSIEIGTTPEVKASPDKNINFDHNSPVAEGRNSIAIGTSAEAGKEMTDKMAGEAIAIGAKAKATKEQSIAIGGDTRVMEHYCAVFRMDIWFHLSSLML
ncbi:TPA: hypothetical protein ACH3LE_001060 [Escherichia coli]|uniref:hypothetical protein n=1 Tax=Escherichia coli TaxID=562 RepID=UPI00295E602E|nr:hypothetical protein [Escherichia coli]